MALDRIAVLRQSTHGMPIEEYEAALRKRFPDRNVVFARTRTEEIEAVGDADIVTSRGIDEDLLAHADNLQLFACHSVRYEHRSLDALADRGVAVTNGSGIHAPNMAEHVVGNLLVFSRRFHEAGSDNGTASGVTTAPMNSEATPSPWSGWGHWNRDR